MTAQRIKTFQAILHFVDEFWKSIDKQQSDPIKHDILKTALLLNTEPTQEIIESIYVHLLQQWISTQSQSKMTLPIYSLFAKLIEHSRILELTWPLFYKAALNRQTAFHELKILAHVFKQENTATFSITLDSIITKHKITNPILPTNEQMNYLWITFQQTKNHELCSNNKITILKLIFMIAKHYDEQQSFISHIKFFTEFKQSIHDDDNDIITLNQNKKRYESLVKLCLTADWQQPFTFLYHQNIIHLTTSFHKKMNPELTRQKQTIHHIIIDVIPPKYNNYNRVYDYIHDYIGLHPSFFSLQ
jgi:hypothetical protein